MDFVLTYKTARLVKDAASHLDEILDISNDIENLRSTDIIDKKMLEKSIQSS